MLSIVSKVCHYYLLHCNSNYIRQLKKVLKYTYVKKVAEQVKMKTIAKLAISVQQAWSNTTKIFLQSFELFYWTQIVHSFMLSCFRKLQPNFN